MEENTRFSFEIAKGARTFRSRPLLSRSPDVLNSAHPFQTRTSDIEPFVFPLQCAQ
jgi:hypothetical protein